MALEIGTVGATVKYATPTASTGACPTTGFTEIENVVEAPAVEMTVDTIEVSNIKDSIKRYISGQQDMGADQRITLNHTEAAITAWEAAVTAAGTAGLWWEYVYPGATKSFFFKAMPKSLGNSGIQKNTASTLSAPLVIMEIGGWKTAST